MKRKELRDRLRAHRAPDESSSAERSWGPVRDEFARRTPRRSHHRRRGFIAGGLGAIAAAALILTPAGAQVGDWVREVVDPPGIDRAEPSLDRLPGGGRILVDSGSGAWIVDPDGSKRNLGEYSQSGWSPRGLFAAMASGNVLTAVDVHDEIGDVRWSLTADGRIDDPVWAPSGQRVAYLADADRRGAELRVVAGDGTGDRLVAERVAPVAPAWLPESEYTARPGDAPPTHELAYLGRDDRTVHLIQADTGLSRFSARFKPVAQLAWTDSRRLLVVQQRQVTMVGRSGGPLADFSLDRAPSTVGFQHAAALEDESVLATTYDPTRDRSSLIRFDFEGERAETLFAGPGRFYGPVLSPDGRRALVEWPEADQWLFVPLRGDGVDAVSGIARQFSPGEGERAEFPAVAGWCCPGG